MSLSTAMFQDTSEWLPWLHGSDKRQAQVVCETLRLMKTSHQKLNKVDCDDMMSAPAAPIKSGPNVPAGCILVNELWRGSNFETGLSAVGRGIYCDNLDLIDFYLSELCPVIYINECELISKLLYERKLNKIHQVAQHHGVVVAVRNNTTIKEFSELQNRCFALNLTLVPLANVSELPQLLLQMAYMECKSPRNPFKQGKKSCDELVTHQLKLFTLIPGVGEKKARTLLNHFGHPQGLASVPEDLLIAKLTPLIGESSARNVFDFFYTKVRFTRS